MTTRLERLQAQAQAAMFTIAKWTMAGVSEMSGGGDDYVTADAALRLIAHRAGVKYETDDAYKQPCEECAWPLPLNETDDPSMHADWCAQAKEEA